MSIVKAGSLKLGSFKQHKESKSKFATLLYSENIEELVEIVKNANANDIKYYVDRACNIYFRGIDKTSGITEIVLTPLLSSGAGVAAGAGYAILGATPVTTGGIFGFFATTAVIAPPAVAVAGVGIGAAALVWGACKLIGRSARKSGKSEHFDKTMQEGRWVTDPVRILNPFAFMNEERQNILKAYNLLSKMKAVSEADKKEFLRLFSAEVIHTDDVEQLRKDRSMMNGNLDKVLQSSCGRACRSRSLEYSVQYIQKLEKRV